MMGKSFLLGDERSWSEEILKIGRVLFWVFFGLVFVLFCSVWISFGLVVFYFFIIFFELVSVVLWLWLWLWLFEVIIKLFFYG